MSQRNKLPAAARVPAKFEPIAKPRPLVSGTLTVAPFTSLSGKIGVPTPASPLPVSPAQPVAPGAKPPLPALPKAPARATSTPPAGTVSPVGVPAAAPAATGEIIDAPLLMDHSSSPAMIKATGLIFKWTFFTAVLLGVGFMAMRFLVPFLKELQAPKTANVVVDKNAPMAVQMLQQTRQTVAKSDANVNEVHDILSALEGKTPPKKEAPKAVAPKPKAAPPPPKPLVKGDLGPYEEAVSKVKFGGVFEGGEPRAYLDGRIVRYGEIFNRELGLRFLGVDLQEHAILFTNADNVTFRKYY